MIIDGDHTRQNVRIYLFVWIHCDISCRQLSDVLTVKITVMCGWSQGVHIPDNDARMNGSGQITSKACFVLTAEGLPLDPEVPGSNLPQTNCFFLLLGDEINRHCQVAQSSGNARWAEISPLSPPSVG